MSSVCRTIVYPFESDKKGFAVDFFFVLLLFFRLIPFITKFPVLPFSLSLIPDHSLSLFLTVSPLFHTFAESTGASGRSPFSVREFKKEGQ